MTEVDQFYNFIPEQRNWSAFNTLTDAVNGLKYKQVSTLVYIISEDTWYYWRNDTDQFVKLAEGIGGGGGIKKVQTIAELKAIPQATLKDGEIILVEDEGELFRYDAQAITGDYAPDDQVGGIGWWIRLTFIQAAEVFYDNSISGLTAIDVQEAIDEIVSMIPTPLTKHSELTLDDGSNPHGTTKTDIGLSNVPNIDATNPANIVQTSSYRFVSDIEKGIWNGKQDALGFTPENVANKVSSFQVTPDNIHYPTEKLVKDSLDGKSDTTHNHSGVYEPANSNIQNHISIIAGNPHGTTKTDIGLSNVTNDTQVKKIAISVNDNLIAWDGISGDLPKDSGLSTSSVSTAIANTHIHNNKTYLDTIDQNLAKINSPEFADNLITTLKNVTSSGIIPDVQWLWMGTPTDKSVLSFLSVLTNRVYGFLSAFNGANQLVQMTAAAKLPAVDGSLLTGITPTQVGLGNVTNDAQLKRAAGDFNTFTEKTSLTANDIFLIEDSADSNNKKKILANTLSNYTGSVLGSIIKEPTGFVDRTTTTISFSDIDRTFSITPTSSSFFFYIKGVKYIKNSTQSIQISDTAGIHYIYFDASGNISETITYTSSLLIDYAIVAMVTWDKVNAKYIYLGDERHSVVMDGDTHFHIHGTFGTAFSSGLLLQNFVTDGNGGSDTHAQFSVNDGVIRDEDLSFIITDGSPQDISPILKAPIFYKSGTDWVKDIATNFPVKRYGTGRLAYNSITAGSGSQIEVTEGYYIPCYIFATPDINHPIVAIQGRTQYSQFGEIKGEIYEDLRPLIIELESTSSPFQEFLCIGVIIYQTSSTYANTVKARVLSVISNSISYYDLRYTLRNDLKAIRVISGETQVTGKLTLGKSLTPSALTGKTDNYNPTGIRDTVMLRISATGNYNLTGISAPTPAEIQLLFVVNVGTNNIIVKDNNASSLAENRFNIGADKTLQGNEGIFLLYDDVSLRWRAAGVNI